jgi:hypothetical protein
VKYRAVEILKSNGPAMAFIRVQSSGQKTSLNFLYAMAAGLEDRDWRELCKEEKGRLNLELADLREMLPAN